MDPLILGNAVSLAGSVVMVLSGLVKSKKGILLSQCLMFVLLAGGNLILGGVSGAIVDGVSIVRNILSFFIPFTALWKAGFICLFFLLCLMPRLLGWTDSLSVLDFMPAMGCTFFTLVMDAKDGRALKAACILGQLMWCFYDFSIRNYTALAFDVMTILSNVIGILMLRRDAQKQTGG